MRDAVLAQKIERDELLNKEYVAREGLEECRRQLHSSFIQVIIGPRRAGKSVFAVQLLRELP